MIIATLYLIVAFISCLSFGTVRTMEQEKESETPNGDLLRIEATKTLPKIADENPTFAMVTFGPPVMTHHDNNFVEKFLGLLGISTAQLDEEPINKADLINQSLQIKTGTWKLSEETRYLSTGHIHECVTIVIQYENPNLAALYHYFEKADPDFEKLDEFLSAVKQKALALNVPLPNFTVSLISSYVSQNFLVCKNKIEEMKLIITKHYVRPRVYVDKAWFVKSDEKTIPPGLIVFASPSKLIINRYNLNDPGNYDSELPVDEKDACCIF